MSIEEDHPDDDAVDAICAELDAVLFDRLDDEEQAVYASGLLDGYRIAKGLGTSIVTRKDARKIGREARKLILKMRVENAG